MSVIGIVLMWVFFAAVFAAFTLWPTGSESDRRDKYWSKYLNK